MESKALYALTVLVSVGALSYLLRAMPFLLFGTRGEPPAIVKYIGRVLSPAAIAMLVVYCYAGEVAKLTPDTHMWARTAPYLAGVFTIALQLWRRNPLLSIISGTLFYMLLVRL